MKYYLFKCCWCEKYDQHFISKTSRKRGVKLTCCSCGKESKRYTTTRLEEYNLNKKQEVQKWD